MESDSSVINRLEDFLLSKFFKIEKKYTIDGRCAFVKVFSQQSGDDLVVSIPSEYSVPINDGVELILFSDVDTEVDYSKTNVIAPYQEMSINGLENDSVYLDPLEVDRLMEQYQAINIDSEKAETLKSYMSQFKKQLDRLKSCTNNIKYKLCIISECCLCVITKLNTVECYAVKSCIPNDKLEKDLLISIDLESFYDKMDTVHQDIERVYKNLYLVLNKAHERQSSVIDSRLRQYQGVQESIKKTYSQKSKYEDIIKKLENDLRVIKREEDKLIKKIESIRGIAETHMSKVANKSFNLDHLKKEYENLLNIKDEVVNNLAKLKKNYNNFVLDFDRVTFDNIILFKKASSNFISIGVIPEHKKLS